MIKSLSGTVKSIVTANLGIGAYDNIRTVNYDEKLAWNGYKWMEQNGIKPLFAFGHGLSYSTYRYSEPASAMTPEGDVAISFNIKNERGPLGSEVAQVYVTLPADVPGNKQPPKKLVGWARVDLAPGENKNVTVHIPKKYISTWDIAAGGKWVATPGNYIFTVSDSSAAESENTLTVAQSIQ